MDWWWILLIVCGVQGLFLLVWWLLNRNKGTDINRALEDSTTTRLKEELEAEREKGDVIAAANVSLTAKFKEVAAWYDKNKDQITQEAADEFKTMAGDPEAVDAWLDGLSAPDTPDRLDPTKPATTTASTNPEKP